MGNPFASDTVLPRLPRRAMIGTVMSALVAGIGWSSSPAKARSAPRSNAAGPGAGAAQTSDGAAVVTPTSKEIEHFLHQQLIFWNAGKRDEMRNLYRRYAKDRLIIEYVGMPIGDGWKAFEHMWDSYNGKVKTEAVEVMVNGNEGACFLHNVRVVGGAVNPSIEVYKFTPGQLHIRYFHRSAEAAANPPPQ